jgi:predicted phosphodiesterase
MSGARVAVVSDLHGGLAALEAVVADLARRAPDAVVCGGDLALMGGQPAEVVRRVRELGWPAVVGNTDEVLWAPRERGHQARRAPQLQPLLDRIFGEYAPATLERLDPGEVEWLRGLPPQARVGDVLVLHATPGDLWRAPLPEASDDELRETYGALAARTVVYGHVHRPFVRALGDLTVANSGSAGMAWDGDPRASYVLVADDAVEVVRVEYDVERDAAALRSSGYPDAERLGEMRRRAGFLPLDWRADPDALPPG